MNVQDITVDLSKKNVKPESVVLRQGDKSGTTLRVKVLDGGVDVSSLSGYTAKFVMKLPNNRFYYEVAGTISGGTVEFLIDESLAAVEAGVTNIAYVALVNGDITKMSANNVRVEILPSALDAFTPPPEWTDPIDEFIEEQTERVDVIVESAESATTSATDAATAANSAASAAGTAAIAASSAASAAGEAAANANAAAIAANALLSGDTTVDTFARRTSDHDGACRIKSLQGRTVVWNQLAQLMSSSYFSAYSVSKAPVSFNDGIATMTVMENNNNTWELQVRFKNASDTVHENHVYLACCELNPGREIEKVLLWNYGYPAGGGTAISYNKQVASNISVNTWTVVKTIYSPSANSASSRVGFAVQSSNLQVNDTVQYRNFQVFDLTLMFGAGNEPATVEEFEAMFPDAYYPYNAGELVSVNVEGVESVGFNLWDGIWEEGTISVDNGTNASSINHWRTKNYIPVSPLTEYYAAGVPVSGKTGTLRGRFYDASKAYIGYTVASGFATLGSTFTTPANCRYMRFAPEYANIVDKRICINISDPALNGIYRPYTEQTREIPASTYFPDGLRSAGSVYDELTSGKAITRIGAVDLGTLNWSRSQNSDSTYRYYTSDLSEQVMPVASNTSVGNLKSADYQARAVGGSEGVAASNTGIAVNPESYLIIYDVNKSNLTTSEFKTAMSGVMLYYELATPTETAIEPPLNMTYPVEAGGTESIVVPTGEQSAPPTMAIVYAYNADGVRDISQAIIANIEGAKASTNYAIGGYFVHAGKLYKATSAIATGEAINPGTNCVQTTVMAELVALTA